MRKFCDATERRGEGRPLREDSPLVALGTQPLDLSGVGPRGLWQTAGGHPPSPRTQVAPATGYLWNINPTN